MTELELRATAIAQELSMQRNVIGDRAANLAADNAELRVKVSQLEKRIAELEKPKDAPA